jgi:hypothetical protein
MESLRLRLSGFIPLVLVVALLSCGKKDIIVPTQVLLNTDIESGGTKPDYWFVNPGTSGAYTGTWTDEESSSKAHSLKISANATQTTDFAYWVQTYSQTTVGATLPFGKDLTLSLKIKGKDLVGQGLSIAIRADNALTPTSSAGSTFVTTQGNVQINGTFDWKTYTVKMSNLRSDALYVYVFLVYLPNTTGTAYFDDVTLTY